ncbi:phytanoyl-CoA dioxygenase family protein [Nostoc ellipsosporum NOK]|nr:phytanoyl-CoA dioxygenase family protein [Nostoc ellipsosporum NOK]
MATRGAEQVQAAATAFREWTQQRGTTVRSTGVERRILSDEQMQSWQEQGYIKVSGLIDKEACDAVTDFICSYLGLDLHDPSTWYLERTDWHGLMVQQYQHASMQAIRSHPDVKQLFAELYNTDNIILQTDKVSFNPPETNEWKFVHHQLHWDMDYQKPNPTYIQGLIYLNDVPRDRGPLKVVPGFHRQFDEWKEKYPDEAISYEEMRKLEPEYISGKKGDIVLWLQTLPHAASPNHSDLPRFVQYLSFNRL